MPGPAAGPDRAPDHGLAGLAASAFWTRANTYFNSCGITVLRVLTDNGAPYRSKLFAQTLGPIKHKQTRPYRPQTNGKVERFNRTLGEEWAYARLYLSEAERAAAYPEFIHTYFHHRGHTALGGKSPADRVPNLRGQYTKEAADDRNQGLTTASTAPATVLDLVTSA